MSAGVRWTVSTWTLHSRCSHDWSTRGRSRDDCQRPGSDYKTVEDDCQHALTRVLEEDNACESGAMHMQQKARYEGGILTTLIL